MSDPYNGINPRETFTPDQADGFVIDTWFYAARVRINGASGGGERIKENLQTGTLDSIAGFPGGDTHIFGINCVGGLGGGRLADGTLSKNFGGNGGYVSTIGNQWTLENNGVVVTKSDGSTGGLNTGGESGDVGLAKNKGGDGSDGNREYVTTVYHDFNNTTDVTNELNNSVEVSVTPLNVGASGYDCGRPYYGKQYQITFTTPYIDDKYTFNMQYVAQQAAGGNTGGAPYTYDGFGSKNKFGIKVWFCASGATTTVQTGTICVHYGGYCGPCPPSLEPEPGQPAGNCGTNQNPIDFYRCCQRLPTYTTYNTPKNTFIRQFTFRTNGIKEGAVGRGGGGGAQAEFILTRQNLIDQGIDFSPINEDGSRREIAAIAATTVGAGGIAVDDEQDPTDAFSGLDGQIDIDWLEYPQVYVYRSGSDEDVINLGESATLEWDVEGDASSMIWINAPITNTNLTGSAIVSPLVSTTYQAIAIGEILGQQVQSTNPGSAYRLRVAQPPVIDEFEVPSIVNYGEPFINIKFAAKYCNISAEIVSEYDNDYGPPDVQGTVDGPTYTIDTSTISFEYDEVLTNYKLLSENFETADENGFVPVPIQWGTYGPTSITLLFSVAGRAGVAQVTATVPVNTDYTPDQIVPPQRDNLIINQLAVTPDTIVENELMLVEDIDVPVEIKSNYPIQVDVNQSGSWNDIRQIGG